MNHGGVREYFGGQSGMKGVYRFPPLVNGAINLVALPYPDVIHVILCLATSCSAPLSKADFFRMVSDRLVTVR